MKLEIDIDELTAEERASLDDFLSGNPSLPVYFVRQDHDAEDDIDTPLSELNDDRRIQLLHEKVRTFWPRIESIIDQLKALGPHSLDGDNALLNTREWLDQLSRR